MGQRLVISNRINGQEVNNIYYHWSAYTISSIQELIELRDKIIEYYQSCNNELVHTIPVTQAMMNDLSFIDFFNLACLNAVSGISDEDESSMDYVSKITNQLYRNDDDELDRNLGLIAFSEHGRECNLYWSEGTLVVDWIFENNQLDLDKSKFDMSELYSSYNETDFMICFNNDKEILKELKEEPMSIQMKELPIKEANDDLIEIIDNMPNCWYDDQEKKVFGIIQ